MIEIGKYQPLSIARRMDQGYYLEDHEGEEVLLPNKYITPEMKIGDSIEVFIYNDSEDRIVATTEKPLVTADEFAFLEVKEVTKIGAFLDMGLEKDLLVPFNNQQKRMETGKSYLVYVYLDETTERLVGTTKFYKHLSLRPDSLGEKDSVDIIVGEKMEIGFFAVVNQRFHGMLYFNEVFKEINTGDNLKAYINAIRPDGKIDLTLEVPGYKKIEPNAEKILTLLRANDGKLNFSDKSNPDDIKSFFGMSKKTFKQSIGALYKERLINIEENSISLK